MRRAAAAAMGASTIEARLKAQSMRKGGQEEVGRVMAADAVATPKIRNGTYSGRQQSASRSPLLRKPRVRLAPIEATKLTAGVPTSMASTSSGHAATGRLGRSPSSGAGSAGGTPVVSQWARLLTAATRGSGKGPVVR